MFVTPIVPRVSETDGAGHINNVFIPVWLEAGRREVFRILTPDLGFTDWRVALVNTNIDYLAQTYFQHEAQVRTWVERVGTKSFTLYEEVWQGERLTARATATYVYFNYALQRSEPLPAGVAEALRTHRREADAASAPGR